MASTNWLKQTSEKPLFPDLLWSRPENRRSRGKLVIIGGQAHSFAAPANAFSAAQKAGIGSQRVLLPDSTRRILGRSFKEAEFATSTPSGSFSREAVGSLMEHAAWANGTLLAGDTGRNAETAIMLESFVTKYPGPVTLTGDTIDYFLGPESLLLEREGTLLVLEFGQLQKLGKSNRSDTPVRYGMSLAELVAILADWSDQIPAGILTQREGTFIAASGGMVSTTAAGTKTAWAVPIAAYAAVWQLQQPLKIFEALTTAVYDYINSE